MKKKEHNLHPLTKQLSLLALRLLFFLQNQIHKFR